MRKHYTLILQVVALSLFCLVYTVWEFGFTWETLGVPFGYSGDGMMTYWDARNIIDTGWIWKSTRLSAPFHFDYLDYPSVVLHNFDSLFLKLILCVIPANPFLAINIAFLLTGPLIAVSAFFVFRELNIRNDFSFCGAALFALLPFYFMRHVGHFVLTMYQFVPLTVLLCVWCYEQRVFVEWNNRRDWWNNRRNLWAVLFCLLIANNGIAYWQAFSVFCLLLTALLSYWDTGERKQSKSALCAAGLILTFFVLALSPAIVHRIEVGKNSAVASRSPLQSDIHGLKITQMLIPYDLPGDTKVEHVFREYLTKAPLTGENRMAYLGLVGSIGFFYLLLVVLKGKRNGLERIFLLSRLNLACVLLATIGGFGTIGSLFMGGGPKLRGYNRISVFIAFFCIASVLMALTRYLERKEKKRYLIVGVFVFLSLVSLDLQGRYTGKRDFPGINKAYMSDRQFIQKIEMSTSESAMIYQMPYHPFPERGPVHRMSDYQLVTGALHSDKLRWSYGYMAGRGADAWHERVNALPMEQRLKVLSIVGFEGIYIDRRAYKPEEMKSLEQELKKYISESPWISEDKNLSFYPMKDYNANYLANYLEEEKEEYRKRLLHNVVTVKRTGTYDIVKNSKGYEQPMDREVTLQIQNDGEAYEKVAEFTVKTATSERAKLAIEVNGDTHEFQIGRKPTKISCPIYIHNGNNTIRLTTDAKKIHAPKDKRNLYMGFVNSDVSVFLPEFVVK